MRHAPSRRMIGMASLLALAGAWGLGPPLGAQDAPAAPADAPAAASLADAIGAITEQFGSAEREFYAKLEGLEDEAAVGKLYAESYPKVEGYLSRMQAALAGHESEPAAAAGLAWVVQHAEGPQGQAARKAALDALLAHHLASPALPEVVQGLAWSMSADDGAFLERVSREAPGRDVKGQALFSLARWTLLQSERMPTLSARPKPDGEPPAPVQDAAPLLAQGKEQARQAEALFVRVQDEYGDVQSGKRTLADDAGAYLFELRSLALGMTAPDIEGTDVEGQPFRLSEYRGKVVVLDFWGFW